MQAGQERFGMQTMNQSLARLVEKRLVTKEVAMNVSSNRDELSTLFVRGVPAVSMAAHRPMARQQEAR
jgi:twitching motility protein PilT